jgi:hypothetical protein
MGLRPQTLYGIADSPVGLAAYFLDHDAGSYELIARIFEGKSEGLTRDDILAIITIAWLTNTALSGARLSIGRIGTPYGLIEREWINAQLRAGSQAIQRCKLHRPPECRCWSASRAVLWQARANGDKTPEGWAAARIYSFLEELELASRPEIEPARSAA